MRELRCSVNRLYGLCVVVRVALLCNQSPLIDHQLYFVSLAIDTDGLLCQTREHNSWHGTRSNKAVINKGKTEIEQPVKVL